MIETVMIFALGFLAASLCALLALPALNARAARLSQRRIEARLPLSVSEVAAEKDYLRAQFAVAQRRLERKVEETKAGRHADMATLGARTLEAAALARTVEEREAAMRERDAVISQTRATLGDVERTLETVRGETAVGAATLEVLEQAHRDALDDLRAIRHARAVAPSDDVGETLRARLAAAEDALAQARRDDDTDDLRRRISDVADTMMRRERLPPAGVFRVAAGS